MTFQISNIISESNQIRVFYRFSDGSESSNLFESNATLIDLMGWGEGRAKFLDSRAEELKKTIEELVEDIP